VFENRVLRGIFRPKRKEVAGSWRSPHNEELHNLHASPNSIRVIKSKRMRWVGYAARMGEMRNSYKVFVGKVNRRDDSEDLAVDGTTILE
jgi:hypothetical protein